MQGEGFAQAVALLAQARRIVALTGAGYSRPSGIPDFRSADGLWARQTPEEVASLRAFRRDPDSFYAWLHSLAAPILAAQPNPAHFALATLEAAGRVTAVITQNIDGLHQRAGSQRVYELHGHLREATCVECGRRVAFDPLLGQIRRGRAPRCQCGGPFKPDVVLFDEPLPGGLFWLARRAVESCDLLLVAGTALEVAPVCDLPLLASKHGARLLLINLAPTYLDPYADLVLREDVATALPAIVRGVLEA